MTHLIDRDKVVKILYTELSKFDIQYQSPEELEKYTYTISSLRNIISDVKSIHTHEDRVKEVIEKKIEEYENIEKKSNDDGDRGAIYALQKLLNELYPNN